MLKTILFILYAAVIPLVPLYGVSYYKKKKNGTKGLVCLGIFAVQSMVSLACIISWLK